MADVKISELPDAGALDRTEEIPVVQAAATKRATIAEILAKIVDGDIPSTIARDTEVTTAVSDHAAAANPHPTYLTQAEGDAAYEPVGTTATHAAASDPHTEYLKESVISGLATPAIVLGSAAAAGSTTTPIRSDATIAAFDATNPSTQAFGDAAVVGTAAFAARRDHKHVMPANPVTAHEAAGDPHTGYILESLLDVKGDLIVASAADTPARLAAGTNGHVLTADSAEATGLKWAAAAGGGGFTKDFHYWKQTGSTRDRWYTTGFVAGSVLGTATVAVDTFFAFPFVSVNGETLDRMAINVTTLAAAGVARFGIYANTSDVDLYPAARILDCGEVSTASTGVKSATISQALSDNTLYWFVLLTGTVAPVVRGLVVANAWPILSLSNSLPTTPGYGWTVAQAYGALPDPYPAGGAVVTSAPLPSVFARAA